MRLHTTLRTILLSSALTCSTLSFAAAITYNESYNIKIQHFSVVLDSSKHDVNINANWTFKNNPAPSEYIDSNLVISEIKKYLTDYPNKSDFWEVVNRNLTAHMIERFSSLRSMKIKIEVPATKMDPYDHYTQVEAKR